MERMIRLARLLTVSLALHRKHKKEEILRRRMEDHLAVHLTLILWFSVHNIREPMWTWFFTLEKSVFIHSRTAHNGITLLANLGEETFEYRNIWHK